MTTEEIKQLIATGQWQSLDVAWEQAVEAQLPLADLRQALEALVQADQLDAAETYAWTLLADRAETRPPAEALEVAQAVVSAVPLSADLRSEAGCLYARIHGQNEHVRAILEASGLEGEQSPRRAFRVLDVCLAIRPGEYLVNRFDNRTFRVERFDPQARAFELTDPAGQRLRLDPLRLGDEFDPVGQTDFRVLQQQRPDALKALLEDDPAAVLTGLCQARGGRVDSSALKDFLVPRHLSPEQWSGWWNRARTAAKRCPQLTLEGRNPVAVVYCPQGRTLEEELAAAAECARTPVERLALLRQYAREARQRKVAIDPTFVRPVLEGLAEQAVSLKDHRPADALAAALALQAGCELGLPAPNAPWPSPAEVLASAPDRAAAVAGVGDSSLWPAAIEALGQTPEPLAALEALLHLAPAEHLDAVADRLRQGGAAQTVAGAVAAAMLGPTDHLELCLWLWQAPTQAPENMPGKVELLSRLLDVLQRTGADAPAGLTDPKQVRRRVRAALSARNYTAFRQAVAEMDQAVAEAVKSHIQRCLGLTESIREDLLGILREEFYALFARAKVEPWKDDNVLWTTEPALRRREALLKEITEVKMLENARAIGAAAAHGDLSENSEWKFALEERDLLRARAAQLQQDLLRARLLTAHDVPADAVGIGSRVTLRRVDDGRPLEMTFLGAWDTDLERNVYSYRSALGAECMGKRVGDVVNVKVEGAEGQYRIEGIASGLP